jgi:predicted transcriptional regulator
MNNMQITSLEAYVEKVYKTLGKRQAVVLHYLRTAGGDHTNAEIAKALNVPINRITPRTGELIKLGLVFKVERRTCKATNGTAWSLRAKHPVLPPAREEAPKQTNALGI